ncbi:amidase [Mycolicibacterium cosmeticum]|nr:amidase [Mycolicibacterium cosmeticum]
MSPAATHAALPTRSEVVAWDTADLESAASRWEEAAAAAESAFDQHRQNVATPTWVGSAKDAALGRATADLAVVRRQGEVQREAANIAAQGGADIRNAQRQAVEAIQDAEADGFRVGEDLSVTDARPVDVQTATSRAVAAAEHAEYIRWRAEQLAQTDALVGRQLQSKAEELAGIRFEGEQEATDNQVQLVDDELPLGPETAGGPPLSENRRRAVEYSEKWAEGFNPDYESLGGGDLDCTNFASQVMRAGGFGDVGNGIDDWRRGDSDDWYYQNEGAVFPGNTSSKTWTLAKENHNFVTQHSGRGDIVGVVPTPSRNGLDPLAPSKAGLLPGDLIYYKDADGGINHVAVYAGQQVINGVPTDVINQHSGGVKLHGDWMPDSAEYTHAPAQVEFVHLRYPGE